MEFLTKQMIRNKSIPELKDKKLRISVEQAQQLTTYLNNNTNEFEYGQMVWFSANQFIRLSYTQAALTIADGNGFEIFYLRHVILALYPEKYCYHDNKHTD